MRSRSVNFFNFLKSAANEDAEFDIASIRIRNFPDTNMISAVIRFRTGIVVAEQEDSIFPFQIDQAALDIITPNEMGSFFANTPVRRPVAVRPPAAGRATPSQMNEPPALVRASFFVYIGTASSNGTNYAMMKDTRTDQIIKFSFNLAEKNHIRYSDTGSFLVTHEGTEYEVIR
jgi:hypothetical protein